MEDYMISKVMQDAINEQINKELFSSYLYLSMAAYFGNQNLPGFAKWMRVQTDEEREHAMKFFEYLVDRGGSPELKAISAPAKEWASTAVCFDEVLKHEQFVTKSINDLYELALKEKDYPTQVLLQWYINEQVEEEKNATEIIGTLKLIEARETAVLMLDKTLGKRGSS
jgi:ferritin